SITLFPVIHREGLVLSIAVVTIHSVLWVNCPPSCGLNRIDNRWSEIRRHYVVGCGIKSSRSPCDIERSVLLKYDGEPRMVRGVSTKSGANIGVTACSCDPSGWN